MTKHTTICEAIAAGYRVERFPLGWYWYRPSMNIATFQAYHATELDAFRDLREHLDGVPDLPKDTPT